eukprot:TRINITY_DN92402_c0_g1_i1.p1 TRINITY_DN92402_c0_g1~~TRINITY_DN92402_c0_g1_i1.p1  ORF type:complete len:349 (+),score=50.46 TRINITY_DN92402_c0_g1_i1:160-1206(+)
MSMLCMPLWWPWPARLLRAVLLAFFLPVASIEVQVGSDGSTDHRARLESHGILGALKVNRSMGHIAQSDKHSDKHGLIAARSSVMVSSWLAITMINANPGKMQKQELETLGNSIRVALAESLAICRASVRVKDLSMTGGDDSIAGLLQAATEREQELWRAAWQKHFKGAHDHEDGKRLAQLIRRVPLQSLTDESSSDDLRRMNYTRLKASYDILIFPEMRVDVKEVMQRVDHLQIFSRFANLNHALVRSLMHYARMPNPPSGVMLDDVGYSKQHVTAQPNAGLSSLELEDCLEEGYLTDAREMHQYVIACCCLLVLFITCAGSAIFSLKQPSYVPSRTNPLLVLRPRR